MTKEKSQAGPSFKPLVKPQLSWRFLVTRNSTPATKAVRTAPQAYLPQHKLSANKSGSFFLKTSERTCRSGWAWAALQVGRLHRNETVTECRFGRNGGGTKVVTQR